MVVQSTPYVEKEIEINPWLSAAARFDEAAERLGLDEGLRKLLRAPALEVTVNIPVQLDDGRLEIFTGYRVQHSIARGPAKGGDFMHARAGIELEQKFLVFRAEWPQ